MFLSGDTQTDFIEPLTQLTDFCNIESQLNKANSTDTKTAFLILHLLISNGFGSCKIYDKHNDFKFDIVNFPFLDGDVPHGPSYGVYISLLIRFASLS